MQLPTVDASIRWAREQAFSLVNRPSAVGKYCLMLLYHIKQLEKQLKEKNDD